MKICMVYIAKSLEALMKDIVQLLWELELRTRITLKVSLLIAVVAKWSIQKNKSKNKNYKMALAISTRMLPMSLI